MTAFVEDRPNSEGRDRLLFALFVAFLAHLVLILGVAFRHAAPAPYSRQLEVTLVQRPAERAPTEASHIAEQNQAGPALDSGALGHRAQQPLPQRLQSQEAVNPSLGAAGRREGSASAVVTTSSSGRKLLQQEQPLDRSNLPARTESEREARRLERELARLQSSLQQQSRGQASRETDRPETAVAARESDEADYLRRWRQRVEEIGNIYYPEISRREDIYGKLRLRVIIAGDGSLDEVNVLSSSGHRVLDEAAVNIVRIAAPFAPLPDSIRDSGGRLEIIRTWYFEDNRLVSH